MLSAGAPWTTAGVATPIDRDGAYYYYLLAQKERLKRNYLQSTKQLRRAIELDPNSVYLRLELARLLRMLRQSEAALESIEDALEMDPEHAEAHRLAGDMHVGFMDVGVDAELHLREAVRHYEKAMAGQPETEAMSLALGRLYYYQGEVERALSILKEHLLQNPTSVEALFWIGKVQLSRHEFPEAEASLREALEHAPYNYDALLTLANILEMNEKYEEAIEVCERALAVAQDSVEVRYTLARLALKLTDYARAAREYGALLALMKQRRPWNSESELADLYLFTARAQWFSEDAEMALRTLREGGQEFGKDLRFLVLRGELLMESGEEEEEGRAALEKALSLAGEDQELRLRVADAYFNQGANNERQGRYDRAEDYLKRTIALHPDHAGALNYLGYMLVETSDRFAESLQYIERAVALEPENGDYLDSLGWVHYKLNRLDEAEKELQRALERTEGNAIVYEHLGDVVLRLGRPEEALRYWEAALERATGLEEPDKVREKIESLHSRGLSSSAR